MIIAGAGLTQGRVLRADTARGPRQYDTARDLHDAFDHPRNLGAGKPVIAVAALLFSHDQPDGDQSRQMAAGGLRRDRGDPGQFVGRQGEPIHQRRQHGRARGLAHGGS